MKITSSISLIALFALSGINSISLAADTQSSAYSALISEAPENAEVYIISPADGASVRGTFTVKFGLKDMGVAPAGANFPKTGHHHLLIDLKTLPDLAEPLPANDNIIHFGGGQTETTITLSPGQHTLQLLMGNYVHIPHSKPILSQKILVNVQ